MSRARAGSRFGLWHNATWLVLGASIACGGGEEGAKAPASTVTPPSTVAGSGATAAVSGQGATLPTAGRPGTTVTPPATVTPPTVTPPASAGGAGAVAVAPSGGTGAPAAAGSSAGADAQAGAGGAAAAAGGPAVTPATGEAFAIRGADPTDESANGRNKGPYAVESYTSGYKQGDFSDATMWYPTSAEAKPPFGCVAVVPGFVSPQSSIRNWGPFLASNGIVTITIGVPGSDQPNQRAASLMSALETCKGENTREGSPVKGKLSEKHLAVSGWSMGGGGTLIAASKNPDLKAAVSFAAWGPTGGGMNKVPALMFEATADALAASMSDSYYRAVPDSVPKMLFEVSGSSHNVANDPANHQGIIGKYGLSWFKVFLEGDERYRKFLTAPAPDIVTDKFAHNLK